VSDLPGKFGEDACMKRLVLLLAPAVLCAWLMICPPAFAQAAAEPTALPTVTLRAGMFSIKAELAKSPAERAQGLMFRTKMDTHEGMLFVFDSPTEQCFWMKNTLLPLSIAFLAEDGSIVNVADMAPQTETSHCSAKPVRFALEMNQGWFAKRGMKAGLRITGGPFSP
jgi:uncharacterized protein